MSTDASVPGSQLDPFPLGLVHLTVSGSIVAASAPFAALVNTTPDALRGTRVFDWVHKDDRGVVAALLDAARFGLPIRTHVEIRLVDAKGTPRAVDLLVREDRPVSGPVTRLWWVVVPTGRAWSATPDGDDGQHMLRRALAGVAHEINNPLASIAGHAHRLLRESASADRSALEGIVREVKRAGQAARDMLAVTRQGFRSQPDRVDLNAIVRRAALPWEEKDSQIPVDLILCEEVPLVLGLPATFDRIIGTLTQAAVLRSRERGAPGPARVRVSTAIEGAMVVLRVEDAGAALSGGEAEAIWHPFGTDQDSSPLSGLRLPVVHRSVVEQGGQIEVHPMVPAGNVVVVRWPAATMPDSVTPVQTSVRGPLDVLIVDDDSAIRELLTQYLTIRGHAAIGAESGEMALRLAERQQFDVVIADWLMPGLDGIAVLRRLRQRGQHEVTRLILATGDLELEQGDPLFGDLADVHVVHKPFDIDALARLIERP